MPKRIKNEPSNEERIKFRLLELAKTILHAQAYGVRDVLLWHEALSEHEIDQIESAQIDLMEAYTKIERILINHREPS